MYWIIRNKESREILCPRVKKADSFFLRFMGLMGKRKLNDGEGLFLEKVSSIHTCFMRFTIDVVYLDKDMRVVYVETVPPWHLGKLTIKSAHILELPKAAGEKFKPNIQIEIYKQADA